MAACVDQELLLGAFVDGELDAANVVLVEAHVAGCKDCRLALERMRTLHGLLGAKGVRHEVPETLAKTVANIGGSSSNAANENRKGGWFVPAVGGAIAASLAIFSLVPLATPSPIDQELVSSHVRSLQPGHLTDVQTTNQHIVKPWFNGRIDFSPPVPELADQGFPLQGGRLDSIDGKTVAAIVYHRRLHTVNLFVWPAKDAAERSFVKDGFAVNEWSRNGLRFAAISDIPPDDLRRFETLFVKRSG